MPPPPNLQRRRSLADAAIEVLGQTGIHGLSHRSVDIQAGLPAGTTSNYFRSRDALLQAAAERVVELHRAEMAAATGQAGTQIDHGTLVELIAGSLLYAATEQRIRHLAICELTLESTRRPELARTVAELTELTLEFTMEQHRSLGLPTTRDQVRTLMALYGGTLYALVTAPPSGEPTMDDARRLARAIVTGALGGTGSPE